ncbi:TnpV protein [Eubacterium ventriosum]|uniref:TnpV protein n=1 Tax=Eubacterium ventriosum TaxID=39496 RepID=UPI002E10779D
MKEKRITYHEGADGMLYPNLELPQEQEISMTQIGKYGMMAAEYLKENERNRYNTLYRLGRLAEKMKEVDTEANSLMDTLMTDYLKKHKPQNPTSTMEMWKLRNQAKMMAEEVVLNQIVYRFH